MVQPDQFSLNNGFIWVIFDILKLFRALGVDFYSSKSIIGVLSGHEGCLEQCEY